MRALKDYATPVSVLILASVLLYDHFALRIATPIDPTMNVNGQVLGKAYSAALVASYADAWNAAATTLEQGKSVSEAQKTLQDTWKDGRTKAFKAKVEPGFAQVLPEGTEPGDAAKRSQVAQLWRAFAKGLTGAR
jgi:hypothetical protein